MLHELCGPRRSIPGAAAATLAAALLVAGCLPSGGGGPYTSDNDKPIPGVVGMKVERACRTIGETGHASEVSFIERVEDVEPGRVLAQDPGPDPNPGTAKLVYLTVSGPFSERRLSPNTSCANPQPGNDDAATRSEKTS